jgi:hypothetical protein
MWRFLKIAILIGNFSRDDECDLIISRLPIYRAKNYNAIKPDCYWYNYDTKGDGTVGVSVAPFARLINAIADAGLYPIVGVETYAVGGGGLPRAFWEANPDADAIDDQGNKVNDDEYGFNTRVVSIFSPVYRTASNNFVKNLTALLPHERILYFEPTVEPQFMGSRKLCYSLQAKNAYNAWLEKNNLTEPKFPDTFPIPASFSNDATWNRFRAETVAEWINEYIASFRSVAGKDKWVAVDYLEAGIDADMQNRLGNRAVYLESLRDVNILQVNWHWSLIANEGYGAPNMVAYDAVKALNRPWAISEHMTLNGYDFRDVSEGKDPTKDTKDIAAILRNTLTNGTRFGWEFVHATFRDDPNPYNYSIFGDGKGDPFTIYNSDGSPKSFMAKVDDYWSDWENEIYVEPFIKKAEVTLNPAESGGKTDIEPFTKTYTVNNAVLGKQFLNVTAIPDSEFDFVRWKGIDDTAMQKNPNLCIQITKDMTVTPVFTRKQTSVCLSPNQ